MVVPQYGHLPRCFRGIDVRFILEGPYFVKGDTPIISVGSETYSRNSFKSLPSDGETSLNWKGSSVGDCDKGLPNKLVISMSSLLTSTLSPYAFLNSGWELTGNWFKESNCVYKVENDVDNSVSQVELEWSLS